MKTHINLNIKTKAILALLMSVFFILTAVFINHLGTSRNKLRQMSQNLQTEIIHQENVARKSLSQIRNDLENQKEDSLSTICFLNRQIYVKPEMTFLVFLNDSLIFWSTNNVPLYGTELNRLKENAVIEMPNGTYIVEQLTEGPCTFVGLILIHQQYAFENQFLINRFNKNFNIPDQVKLQLTTKNDYQINSKDGTFLFSLDYSEVLLPVGFTLSTIVLLYFIAYFLLLVALFHAYLFLKQKIRLPLIMLIAFAIDVIIIRFVIFYFEIPQIVYKSLVFSPDYLASSYLFASPGDLLLNVISIIFIAYAIFKTKSVTISGHKMRPEIRYVLSFLFLCCIFFIFFLTFDQIHQTILNSTISFNLSNISSISFYTQMILFSIGLLLLSAFFITYRLIIFIKEGFNNLGFFMLYSLPVIFVLTFIFRNTPGVWVNFVMITLLFFAIWYSKSENVKLSGFIYLILLFSLYSSYIFQISNNEKERGRRIIFAEKTLLNRDPLAEYDFKEIADKMMTDTTLSALLVNYPFRNNEEQANVNEYMVNHYFGNLLENYDVQITICDSVKSLELQSDNVEINCWQYFQHDINDFGKPTECDNFYYMDYELDNDNYLGLITLDSGILEINAFIELFPKNIPKGLGYPELLADKKTRKDYRWSDYSFGKYEYEQLVNWFGRYFYSSNFLQGIDLQSEPTSFYINKNGYNHLIYHKDAKTVLVVSKKNPDWLEIVAPFSYLSIFFGLLVFAVYIITRGGERIPLFPLSFKKRLQFTITSLIVFSFLFIGIGSLFYLVTLNNQKNNDILKEKAHSVLIEMEHKLATEEALPETMQVYLNELLHKFSLVFFSDINLYSPDGSLLASSRPEIFNKGLISSKMEPNAYTAIHFEGSSFFIQNEEIGDYQYLSAFMPFRNTANQLIAYINLPYFAKQDELTNEISTFLVAFINIYLIFIALAIYLALIISNYITRPLQLLKEKISGLKLGTTEAKIEWRKKDEIGELVIEYNRMVDELAVSADKLAKSERETAWREMAKQIAHEIKNPLTPMKLSVQYLQKAWDEQATDWDDRLKRFTQTIVEQINSLSVIASEFSDFAKMPRSSFREIDVLKVLESAIGLFRNTTSIQFKIDSADHCLVYADKEQLLRVFNNLIKNSIQAIANEGQGIISISISLEEDACKIVFSDNGKGIPEEEQAKVFYPNFTTKSGGMGLGLAMVKNIIQNARGSISFSSTVDIGTTFTIKLPLPPLFE